MSMMLATVDDMARSFGATDEKGLALDSLKWTPGAGEYFTAKMAEAFDRTTGVRAYEGISTWNEERKAKDEGKLTEYKDEEEYKGSEHYRKAIPFQPGMNNIRAEIYARNFDERRRRETLIHAGSENGAWWYGPVGFGGGLIGSLPDPVNLIPFGGGAVTGLKLAGMTARQVAANSLKKGLIEGAAGNLASSSIAAWDLNSKGENITTGEVLTDTLFGAVAGPLFHGTGSFLSRAGARRSMPGKLDAALSHLPEESPLRARFAETTEGMHRGEASAYAEAGRALEVMDEKGFAKKLRETTQPAERLEIARAMELALTDIVSGRAVDVSPVLKDSPTITKLQVQQLVDSLESGQFADVNFGKLRPDYKAALNEIRTAEGVRPFIGDDLIVPANVVKKLHEERILKNSMTADEVAETLLQVFHLDPAFASSTRYPHIQALVRLRDKLAEIGFVGIDAENRTVVKSLYREQKKRLNTRLDKKEDRSGGTPESPHLGSSESDELSRQPGRFTDHRSGTDENIAPKTLHVNDSTRALDFRPETPEAHEPFPPLSKDNAADLEASGIDPKTGISAEEARLTQLEAEGRLSQADREALLAHNEETARVNKLEEAALSVAECVMKVVE